jgi:hypothetical protein
MVPRSQASLYRSHRATESCQLPTVGNPDNARSHICQVRNQTIACQSASAG